jgi:ribose 5-phosphate isomerase B
MKIAIGNDHIGIELKPTLVEVLKERGIEVIDVGTYDTNRTDYPIYGEKVGQHVASGEADLGIVLCGTGVGIGLAATKVNGVRTCTCSEPYSAKLSREHNNSNVLAMGSRVVGKELAKMILISWLDTTFEGGRHAGRVAMLAEIEKKQCR